MTRKRNADGVAGRSGIGSIAARAGMACWAALCLWSGSAPAAEIDPDSLIDLKLKVVLNLSRSTTLRERDLKYSFFPGGRRCAFNYTGPSQTRNIAELTKIGLRTTVYVSPGTSAERVKALQQAGAEVGVTGYWGASGTYSSLIGANSVQEAFDAVATSRLVIRKLVGAPVLPSGTCGGHIPTHSFPIERNMDSYGGYGAVFQDSNFLSLAFDSQQCLSVMLGLAGPQQVAVRSVNRNTMQSSQVPNELIYYQLLAGQFEGAIREAREGQIVQFSLRDFKPEDLKLLLENIGEYGKHPAIWHATDGMIASCEYIKENVHILDIARPDPKRYEITLAVEKDTFAPYLIVPLTLSLPKRFPIESASFEGMPCPVTVPEGSGEPNVTIPLDAYLAKGCTMSLEQSAPGMTVPDTMPVTLTLTNALDKPITDARLTWFGSVRFSGLTPGTRGGGARTGVKAGMGLTVTGGDGAPFTLAPGETRKIPATARTLPGSRFGLLPVRALLQGKVDGRERIFLGGFEITVAPMMRVDMAPNMRMPLPAGENQYFWVRLSNVTGPDKFIHYKAGPCRGVLTFDLPEGMTAEPAEQPFDFGADQTKSFLFKVTNTLWDPAEVKVRPVIRLEGVAEALELLEPGTTVIRDRDQIDHKPLDDSGLLVYWGFNDDRRVATFTRSAGRAAGHLFPGTTTSFAPGGIRGGCLASQPTCAIHATYKNIDYRQGTILFWFQRDPRVKNDNRFMADPATSWRNGGRSNSGEGMVFVQGVQRDGYASGGLDIRRYPTWGDKTGYIEAVYRGLGGEAFHVQAPYPRSMEDTWCHVAVTWSVKDRRLELFVNGKSAGKADPGEGPWHGVPWDNAADWGHPLVVSTMDHGHWSGTMRDEFYVYNRPLTAEEIAANMLLAKKPVEGQ
ncbi:MAG TPA: LamG-like jellyroll fold domain-containing protein [Phycisphaerae bacterium]|nr:LamG-like jellyroll fold domain-containing protein [Phycisphaerae bacterium]